MPRHKQSTQAKQLTARNKNALAHVELQENKIMPNKTIIFKSSGLDSLSSV